MIKYHACNFSLLKLSIYFVIQFQEKNKDTFSLWPITWCKKHTIVVKLIVTFRLLHCHESVNSILGNCDRETERAESAKRKLPIVRCQSQLAGGNGIQLDIEFLTNSIFKLYRSGTNEMVTEGLVWVDKPKNLMGLGGHWTRNFTPSSKISTYSRKQIQYSEFQVNAGYCPLRCIHKCY